MPWFAAKCGISGKISGSGRRRKAKRNREDGQHIKSAMKERDRERERERERERIINAQPTMTIISGGRRERENSVPLL